MKNQAQRLFKLFLYLFIILIPWQTRWIFYYATLDEQIWEWGKLSLYVNILVLLLAAFCFLWHYRHELRFSKNKLLYLIFAYSIVMGLLSPWPLVSFYYLLLIYLAVIFAHLSRFASKIWVLRTFLIGGFIQSLLALQQAVGQYVGDNKWLGLAEHLPQQLGTAVVEVDGLRVLRAYGSLPHPNILGGFLFVTIFVGIYLWMDFYKHGQKNNWQNDFVKKNLGWFLFTLVTLVLATYGLLASFSRSAVLALVASLFSVAVINVLRRRWLRVLTVVRYLAILVIAVLTFNIWSGGAWTARLQVEGRLEEQSIERRVGTFRQFYTASGKDVLFGQGLGMNTKVTKDHNPTEPSYNLQPIHNIFVLALAEVGVLGLVLILVVLHMVTKEAEEIDVMSTSLLLGLAIIGLFDHYLWTTWTGWLLIAFGLVNLHKVKSHKLPFLKIG